MKHIRLFKNAQQRDDVLASIDYNILQQTNGVPGVSISKNPKYFIPFYVENISDEEETLSIKTRNDNSLNITVEYSTDGNNWSTLGVTSSTPLTYVLSPGNKLYLRANTNAWYSTSQFNMCSIGGVSKVGGNIMSLIYGSSFTGNETRFPNGSTYNFNNVFNGNIKLISASDLILPATYSRITGYRVG